MPSSPRLLNAKTLVLLLLAAAGATVAFWWWREHGYDFRTSVEAAIALLREAGPWAFFAAMAVLPAVGFPLLMFHLTVGAAFGPTLGLSGVLIAAGVALAVNLALTWWLASRALRPWLEAMMARTKYRIPELPVSQHAELTLLVRITPGPPFFVQGYLLGLAGVGFRTYMVVSWPVAMALGSGFIVFGDAIVHGKGRMALFGVSAIAAVFLLIHFLRRRHARKTC